MTRAEERALEAYPVNMTPLNYQDLIEQFGGKTEIDVNTYPRCLFQEGYEQAEKDIKEQMLKDAVEAEVVQDLHGKLHVKTNAISDILYQFGDKVKVIILPKK